MNSRSLSKVKVKLLIKVTSSSDKQKSELVWQQNIITFTRTHKIRPCSKAIGARHKPKYCCPSQQSSPYYSSILKGDVKQQLNISELFWRLISTCFWWCILVTLSSFLHQSGICWHRHLFHMWLIPPYKEEWPMYETIACVCRVFLKHI